MEDFYDLVRRARELLTVDGFDTPSHEVLIAERTATTSGEAISGISVVLERTLGLDLPAATRDAVRDALAEGDRLWNEANS